MSYEEGAGSQMKQAMRSTLLVAAVAAVPATVGATGTDAAHAASWSKPRPIAATGDRWFGEPVLASSPANGAAVVVWQAPNGLRARRVGPRGRFGKILRLGPSGYAMGPYVAMGGEGAAVVVWYGMDNELLARRIGSRGKLGRLRQVAPSYSPGPYNTPEAAVAVDRRGVATIAWAHVETESVVPKGARTTTATVHARRIAAGGGPLGPRIDLPVGGGDNKTARVAVDDSGRATVVWLFSSGDRQSVRAAHIGRGGNVTAAHDLTFSGSWSKDPSLAVDRAGRATVAWISDERTVTVRRLAADGALGPAHVLGLPASQYGPGVAVDRRGNATVAWRDGSNGDRVRARQIGRDEVAGPLLTLSDPPSETSDLRATSVPDVAYDATGAATIVWATTHYAQTARGSELKGSTVLTRRIGHGGALGGARKLGYYPQSSGLTPRIAAGRGALTAAWHTRRSKSSTIQLTRRRVPR
jgi:hypothetical protein